MDYTKKYIKVNKLLEEVFDQINHIRLYKEMILPAELVRAREQNIASTFQYINIKSLLKQKINFPSVKKPPLIVIKVQNQFKEWFRIEEILIL